VALSAWALDIVVTLPKKALEAYFMSFASYDVFSPMNSRYRIRVGSHTLYSNDTMELRNKLEKYIAIERGKRTRQVRKKVPKGSCA
jgi:hypothetical protein